MKQHRFLLFVDYVSTSYAKVFAWVILVLTGVTVYDVTARYVFDAPTGWAYDTEYIMYGTLFMTAGAYAIAVDAHVRGDFVYRLLRPRIQAGIQLALYFLFFFPAMFALFYSGWGYFRLSWLVNEHSASSPTGPPIWPFKGVIPVSAAFLILQGIAEVTRCILTLRDGQWPARLKDVEELEKTILEGIQAGKTREQVLAEVEGQRVRNKQ